MLVLRRRCRWLCDSMCLGEQEKHGERNADQWRSLTSQILICPVTDAENILCACDFCRWTLSTLDLSTCQRLPFCEHRSDGEKLR